MKLEGSRGGDLGEGGPGCRGKEFVCVVHLTSSLQTETGSRRKIVNQGGIALTLHLREITLVTEWTMNWSDTELNLGSVVKRLWQSSKQWVG